MLLELMGKKEEGRKRLNLSKFRTKYGYTVTQLSEKLKVNRNSIISWHRKGIDIYKKSVEIKIYRGNPRLSRCWINMNSRCNYMKDKKYKYYGGKGIKVKLSKIQLWYLWKRDGAENMYKPSIDRINSNKDYVLENCRFIEHNINVSRRFI